MKCNFKWLSLYMDGELSQRKRARLEEHLRVCESCGQILEQLKSIEQMAGREKLPQISEAYWENFSVRVGNKLLLREKDSTSRFSAGRIKRLFQISPFRLKLAAGLASLFIVMWVGKIYMDHRKVPLPFDERQNLPVDLPGTNADSELGDNLETKREEPKPVGTIEEETKFKLEESEETATPTADEPNRMKELVQDGQPSPGKQAAIVLPTEEVTAEKTFVDKHETQNLRRISAPLTAAVPDTSPAKDMEYEPSSVSNSPKKVKGEEHALMMAGSLTPLDSLRIQIQEEEKLIASQPPDSVLEVAYMDLGEKLLQLCQLTQSKEDIAASQSRIQALLDKYLYASTRIHLNETIRKLKDLEKSWE